jgi:putative peptidoglycan lipid II flippase
MALIRATGIVGSGTLLSRVLGFVRDMVIARIFGAGDATDAYFVAFRIPNFFRRLFAEGSFSLAFVPVFAEYYRNCGHEELRRLVDAVSGALIAALLVMTVLGMWGAAWFISVFAPGFADNASQFLLAQDLLRITFPYLFFISLTALAGGILNTMGRFFVPAVTPVLLNVSLIAAALLGAPHFDEPIVALAWGIFFAGVAQFALQLPVLWKLKVLPRPNWRWGHSGVKRVAKLMVPTLLGSSVAQINLLFDTLLASLLISGSVTWLYYADRLLEFPLGVFGVALGTVILPTLSKRVAAGEHEAELATLAWALRWSFLIALPASVGLAMLAEPILLALFAYDAFAASDAHFAAWALSAYALGLPAFIVIKALAPSFYARQDTKTPVKIAVMAMALNMVLNVLFITLIAWGLNGAEWSGSGWSGAGWLALVVQSPGVHAGLALASAGSGWFNAAMLWRGVCKQERAPEISRLLPILWRCLLASGVMALVLAVLPSAWFPVVEMPAWQRVLSLVGLVLCGALSYGAVLLLSRIPLTQLRSPRVT